MWAAYFPDKPLVPTDTRRRAAAEIQKLPGRALARVRKYPPQRGSSYVRTGTLGRGWTPILHVTNVDELAAGIENPVPYMPYVQGAQQTDDMASRGWAEAAAVFDEEWAKTAKALVAIYTGRR